MERWKPNQHVPQDSHGACRVLEARPLGRTLKAAVLLDGHSGPRAGVLLQPGHRILEQTSVAPFGGDPGPLQEHSQVVRTEVEKLLEQLLRLGVGILTARRLDCLSQRITRSQTSRIEIHGTPETGDSLIKPATGRLQLGLKERHVAVLRRQRRRPCDRLRRRIEFTEPEVREAKVRPRRRLPGHQRGRARELVLGIVEQANLERGQTVVEPARRLLVDCRLRRRQPVARASDEVSADCQRGEPQSDHNRQHDRILRGGHGHWCGIIMDTRAEREH